MGRTDISRQAEEVLRHELLPGEHVVSGAEVTSSPSRRGVAAFLALAIAATVLGLASLFGPLPCTPAGGFAAPLLTLGGLLLRRPMFVVVTSERLICLHLSREIPGHKRIWLDAGRAGRKDFTQVEEALARSGAFAQLDPPWPASQFPRRAAVPETLHSAAIPC